jgi:hypothetical protein
MTAPGDDVSDVYRPPEAELREDLPPRSFVHPVVGFAAGLLVIPTVYSAPTTMVMARVGVAALIASLALSAARQMDWRLAAPIGYGISFLAAMVLSVVSPLFGIF